ncbi:glb-7 [Pristionchus pacificus]|uniref:Glb-7 n=1 Tax=Pristionchus pacificus TaxID=54126 RepID=A0A2A6CAX1_PRIPA|nr:glb-7 [Pristionchus pacificus]|eukprot:PDM75250.1 glb-7 [Pristionchus pacificus]
MEKQQFGPTMETSHDKIMAAKMEPVEKMSQDDRNLLRESWKLITRNIEDTAYLIFEMIFSQSPDCKQLFPFMRIIDSSKKRSPEMEFHALRFMQVMESMVNSLDRPTSISPLLDNLGRVHGRLALSRGFKPHHWGVFIECTLFHFRRVLSQHRQFNQLITLDKTIIAWRTLLRCIIKSMKIGLSRDLANRASHKEIEECSWTLPSIPLSITPPDSISLPLFSRKSASLFSILPKFNNERSSE